MTKILLSGCNGAMGRTVTQLVASRDDCCIAAGIDISPASCADFPVYTSFEQCDTEVDVIIDFSLPAALDSLLTFSITKQIPAVICTTGFSDEQVSAIRAASEKAPIFFSGNMSLGINLLIQLAKKAASVLGDTFDIEIVEKHHNLKIDAPSGTALMIANAVSDTLGTSPRYEFDRHSKRMRREKNEIGIHAIRGGTIAGEHDVIFAGPNEVVTLSHHAQSKGVFAAGAVNAAVFMVGRPAGLYDMNDILSEAQ
ncbi:MAG: 4-hydroxy-tetrahydrodipicolinate reductase [Clostridia bacterium]|nr:4-hydroxy-tetrahydrodipicolinate reductase [Clostridia bacterium]